MSDTVIALLQHRIATDPARPFITVVSDEGRVELSAVTLGNWVAKTAGLLAHDLYLAENSVVDVDLPLGWQSVAWQHAIWRAGYAVGLGSHAPALRVRDEAAELIADAVDTVLVGRHPFGLPITPAPTAGIDWSLTARSMPDRFAAPMPLAAATALVRDTSTLTHSELVSYAKDLAARWKVGSGGRALVDVGHAPIDAWLGAALVPVVTDGSIVVWTASRNPTGADTAAEGITTLAH